MINIIILSLTWIILPTMNLSYASLNDNQWMIFVSMISKIKPLEWQIVEKKENVIPFGHYDGLNYSGPKGKLLILKGNAEINYYWKDRNGIRNYEPLFKEALEIWVMPKEYHEIWKRYFVMKRRIPAKKVFSNKQIKVYGMPSYVYSNNASKDRIKEIIPQATEMGIQDSPHITEILSWSTWKKDIKKMLESNDIW